VASEPLIKDPVDMEFTENGDALVLEMPGYPMEDAKSRLLLLKDTDSDGVFDQSVVYAEGLQLANSFMIYEDGVLVAAPPYLLQLHDTNADERADKVDTLMGGFETGNLQHNYNSLTQGLDDWIYAANGGNDGNLFWWEDSTQSLPLRGQDFRFNLKARQIERLGESSGGFGLAMDSYGRFFETHNTTHISHLVFPDRYLKNKPILPGHTLESISDHDENGLARVYPIGEQEQRVNHPEQSGYFSGSCGITYYGGGALGEAFENTVWVADVVLNLLHVDQLNDDGASFKAGRFLEKKDVLASTDRAFRPVNMTVGPDGSMFVLDMHRKVIEHPEWIPDEIEKNLDLNDGKAEGRIYKISKGVKTEPYDFTRMEGKLQALTHPNQWVRMTAQRLLMNLPTDQIPADELREMLDYDSVFGRLHALWILANTGNLQTAELLKALQDKDAAIRENALRIAENHFQELVITFAAMECLTDENERVRMQAALSLSMLDHNSEIYSSQKVGLAEKIIAAADLHNDIWTISALALASNGQAPEVFQRLAATANPDKRLLATLALQETENTISMLESLAGSDIKDKAFIINQLTPNAGSLSGQKAKAAIEDLEANGDINVLTSLAAFRKKLRLPPSTQFLAYSREASSRVLDASLPDSVRLQYMKILDFIPYEQKSALLFTCLENTQPLKLQEAALRQLNGVKEKQIGSRLVKLWSELSPQTRRFAGDLLLYNELHHDALLTGLENGAINIGEMNFDLERRRTLLWWTDNLTTRQRAEKLFSDSGVSNRQAAIDQMKPALSLQGNSKEGRKVFKNTCSSCHMYGSLGVEVGPVLTEISRKSKATLLHDILDPNAAVDPKYINHLAETKDGEVFSGVVSGETDEALTLTQMGGQK
jgi:putative membrane-bound dehydrogenase-like protein